MNARSFEVIAHRGACREAPENTVPAVRRALELGAPAVELDTQLSRDGVVILFHDDSLRKKTRLSGRVSDHPAQRLMEADVGTWFDRAHPEHAKRWAGTGLATLEGVFSEFGRRLSYHLELKAPDAELPNRVLALVAHFGLRDRVTLTSFQLGQLLSAKKIDPAIACCWLLRPFGMLPWSARVRGALSRAALEGMRALGVPAPRVTCSLVARASARQVRVRAWGTRNEEDMSRVIASGAAGMTTDWPEVALRLLESDPDPRSANPGAPSGDA